MNENADLLSEILSMREQIETPDDLLAFVELLVEGAEAKVLEEHSVASYLDGLGTVLFGLDEEARNSPDWKLFGHILLAAFYR